MKQLFFLVTLAATLFLSSCCDCLKGSPKIGELEAAVWTLIEFDNSPVENSQISLRFDAKEKMIYGSAPCNNFFAGYSLFEGNRDNIKIGVGGATRKACPDMTLELAFTSKLSSVVTLKIEGEHIMMINGEGSLVAILAKGAPSSSNE